jgi:NAD+ kinase
MTTVGFVVHPARHEAVEVASEIAAGLTSRGAEARRLVGEPVESATEAEDGAFSSGLDLVVSVGGDGTFLRAARLAAEADCPVLGVKVGRLGFLTEVEPSEAPSVIDAFLEGSARIEERMALVSRVEGDGAPEQWALNEVIVEKVARHRVVRLALDVDGEHLTTCSADGLIVATPTGSTAYSFSARGPIVSPELRCLIVTAVAAHMVFDHSLVLSAGQSVGLEVVGDEPGVLSADGRESVELPVGTRIRVSSAGRPSLLVRRPDARSFFAVVRDKFGLPPSGP